MPLKIVSSAYAIAFVLALGIVSFQTRSLDIPVVQNRAAVADFNSALVSHLALDDGSGMTAADSSGKGNTGTLVGSPSWTTGKLGGGLQFHGTDEAVTIGGDILGSGDSTISMWIQPSSNPYISILASNNSNGFSFSIRESGQRLACTNNGGQATAYSANNTITLNQWQLVTAVRKSDGTCTLYVNGVRSGGGNVGTYLSGGSLYIGRRPASANPFSGVIDDVRIYNRALSDSEIADIFNGGGGCAGIGSCTQTSDTGTTSASPSSPSSPSSAGNSAVVTDKTVTAASCSLTHVQDAVNTATDGMTVYIPAGTCTWSLTSAQPYGLIINDKKIILRGAGIDKTVIDATLPHPPGSGAAILVKTSKPFRITEFTLKGTYGQYSVVRLVSQLPLGTPVKGWRIDHMKFNYASPTGEWIPARYMLLDGFMYGVIDHNTFVGDGAAGVQIQGNQNDPLNGKSIGGNTDWSIPLSLGTDNAVYLEDNTWSFSQVNGAFINDETSGGRMVIRHNSVTNMTFQTHTGAHVGRGGLSYEIYDNTFTSTNHTYRPGEIRSGTGVIFNNVITGNWDTKNITVDNPRDFSVYPSPYLKCDGTNPFDGNTPGETGWPCLDQVGRGPGGAIGHQPSEPLYAWNNGSSKVAVCCGSTHIKEGRDFFNDIPRPGYVPYAYPHPLTQSGFTSDDPNSPFIAPPNIPAPTTPQTQNQTSAQTSSTDTSGSTGSSSTGDTSQTGQQGSPNDPVSITGITISYISPTSVQVIWTTNRPASSHVQYGLTLNYGNATALDTMLVNTHSVTLSGLSPNTTYHYRVFSKDLSTLQSASPDGAFTTLSSATQATNTNVPSAVQKNPYTNPYTYTPTVPVYVPTKSAPQPAVPQTVPKQAPPSKPAATKATGLSGNMLLVVGPGDAPATTTIVRTAPVFKDSALVNIKLMILYVYDRIIVGMQRVFEKF